MLYVINDFSLSHSLGMCVCAPDTKRGVYTTYVFRDDDMCVYIYFSNMKKVIFKVTTGI